MTPIIPSKSNENEQKPISKKGVNEWKEKDVDKWAKGCKIRQDILENILPCNGKLLGQLYNMKREAPEFFYKSITSNKNLPTRDIAQFAMELELLFKK